MDVVERQAGEQADGGMSAAGEVANGGNSVLENILKESVTPRGHEGHDPEAAVALQQPHPPPPQKATSPSRPRNSGSGLAAMLRRSIRDRHTILLLAILAGTLLGVALGFILRSTNSDGFTAREVMYVNFLGDMFLRMLKLLIVPLVVSTLVTGVASLESQASGRLGLISVVYYMITTLLAVLLGILLVATIRPGYNSELEIKEPDPDDVKYTTVVDTLLDLVRNMIPPNIIEAAFRSQSTNIEVEFPEVVNTSTDNASDVAAAEPESDVCSPDNLYACDFSLVSSFRVNVLGLIVISCVLGAILNRLGERGKALLDVFQSLTDTVIMAVNMVMWLAPIGILSLIAAQVIRSTDLQAEFSQLGLYMVTVIVGLALHGFVVLPILLVLLSRRNPLHHLRGVLQAFITAFATASSSATLPVTMQCVEDNLGIDKRVSRFVLPIGATINMDGTALYEAIAVIFIAQANNLDLNFGEYLAVSLTATAASVGAAGIPQAGLVTMALVLTAVGLPLDKISLILSVDWFLDRCRTSINVWGDTIGCQVVDRFARATLRRQDEQAELRDVHAVDNDGYGDDALDMTEVKVGSAEAPRAELEPEAGATTTAYVHKL